MAEQLNDTTAQKTEKQGEKGSRNPLKGLFNYQWIVKNIPFFLFLSALTILYIANGHKADKTIRRINSTTNELKELQYEYKTLKSEMMFRSEERQVVTATQPLGLQVSKETPVRLKAEKQ
ncbi:FtsL-like putative cell division protein [Sediminibacterium roseum]|uniref:FtsL-like putative cell division protein n=1 Tax=Sediminibacterium roseum TaxID=1978412 RepID=UPI001ED8C6C3|nr:FtsL-like putative cell division protein [Sediminibacterium roseum]